MICEELDKRVLLVGFSLCAMFWFHVIYLIWWIVSGYSLPIIFFFDAAYRLSNMTDYRKNSAAALFGFSIDNLAKFASALPYSIWQQLLSTCVCWYECCIVLWSDFMIDISGFMEDKTISMHICIVQWGVLNQPIANGRWLYEVCNSKYWHYLDAL